MVGIAGGPEKCRYATEELGFDACIDYRKEDVAAALKQHCPNGIDVDFENVGGAIMDAVINNKPFSLSANISVDTPRPIGQTKTAQVFSNLTAALRPTP